MPITDGLYKGLFEHKTPQSIVNELMGSDKKSENVRLYVGSGNGIKIKGRIAKKEERGGER